MAQAPKSTNRVLGRPGDYLSPDALAKLLDVPLATLYGWRYKGIGPVGIRIGRHVRYRRADVEEWIEEQVRAEAARR